MTTHAFDSLRDYLDAVDDLGLLRRIEGADWDIEIGALTETVAFTKRPLALLFDDVVDYPSGFRVASNLYVTEQLQALGLGLSHDRDSVELVEEWRAARAASEPVDPVEVRDGPVRENVHRGGDVNLLSFPVPRWRRQDGGRYFGTGDAVITRDPEGEWVNVAPYRCQVYDPRTLGIFVNQVHHGRAHMQAFWERGEPAPIAVCGGQDPHVYAAGCLSLSHGQSELAFAGGLKGEPIEVLVHERTGLPIPATAEIVAIGHVPPLEEDSEQEGPFGECTGYYSGVQELPVIRVEEIWHRDDPILQGSPTMYGPTRLFALGAELTTSAAIWDAIDDEVPNVRGVYTLYQQCQAGSDLTVVSIEQAYAGHARQAAVATLGARPNVIMNSAVIIVDDDVDPSSLDEVLFAFATRCDPAEDVDVVRGLPSIEIDPRLPPAEKRAGELTSSSLLIDACRPYAWRDEFPAVNRISEELRQQTAEKWGVANW